MYAARAWCDDPETSVRDLLSNIEGVMIRTGNCQTIFWNMNANKNIRCYLSDNSFVFVKADHFACISYLKEQIHYKYKKGIPKMLMKIDDLSKRYKITCETVLEESNDVRQYASAESEAGGTLHILLR